MEEANVYMRVGDYVTFESVKHGGFFLSSEGILIPDVVLNEKLDMFDDCRFCIHLPRQYSAAREYDDYVQLNSIDVNNVRDANVSKYLRALQRGVDNETRLNDANMTANAGQLVNYGENVQLYHVKSGKYLEVVPNKLAKSERANLLVTLSAAGSIYSALQIVPRTKISREGDPIPSHAEVLLRIAERRSEFIHTAERDPVSKDEYREINCSLEASPWVLSIFQSSSDSMDPSLLLFHELVYLNDPENRCHVVVDCPVLEQLDIDNPESRITSLDESSVRFTLEDGDGTLFAPPEDEHAVILVPENEKYIDSNALWVVESVPLVSGGAIDWKKEHVQFRHLNTGLYMKRAFQYVTVADNDDVEEEQCVFVTTSDRTDESTVFSIVELNATRKFLSNSRASQLSQSSGGMTYYVERGHFLDEGKIALGGSRNKSSAVNLMLVRYKDPIVKMQGKVVSSGNVLDAHCGLSARGYLAQYLDMTIVPKTNTVATIWPHADSQAMPFYNDLLEKLVYFSQGFPIAASFVDLSIDKSDDSLRRRRQHILREQGILEVLLCLAHRLIPVTRWSERNAALRGKEALSISEEEVAMLQMGHSVLSKCLRLLYYAILDHHDNQMYVADNMPVILSHLGVNQPLSSQCVTEMLSTNMELQETKISSKEIGIFVDKLRASKMGVMYLQLLQACCSCQGNSVENNQVEVAKMLFSDTNDIIINMHADFSKPVKVDWHIQDSLYIPSTPIVGSSILGSSLISKGLPTLSLAWTTKSIDFSPLGLFGKLSVNVQELFGEIVELQKLQQSSSGSNANKALAAKKNASMAQKVAVANYFVAEMFLFAEMCFDRDYVAMHAIDNLFNYDSLVTVLKMDVSSTLKSAAMRLLLCLVVDRDPQMETKIPVFTRGYSEVQKVAEPQLPTVDEDRRLVFALLQQLIAEHLREMAGNPWEEYSRSVLSMLKALVLFNFYGTFEKARDVMSPLLAALDRRTADFSKKPISSGDSLKASGVMSSQNENSMDPEQEHEQEYEAKPAVPVEPWQRTLLTFLESVPVLIAVLALVLIACSLVIFQILTDEDDSPTSWLFAVNNTILAIFILEFGFKLYCYWFVHTNLIPFFADNFNQIDLTVITLDVVFLCLPDGGNTGSYSKTLRLLRLLRLLRILRAARIVSKLAGKFRKRGNLWQAPIRYSKAPKHELETMVDAFDILDYCQRVIDDRNMSLLLRKFYEWDSGEDTRSVSEIFAGVIEASEDFKLGGSEVDEVLLDILMFEHPPLVQAGLELLMKYHSKTETLVGNLSQVQLLASHKRERQFKIVGNMLSQLYNNAETFELWGELQSDSDLALNKQTTDILTELLDICRTRRVVLEFGEDYMPDQEMQKLFRNLNCFPICMKVLGLIEGMKEPDEDGKLDPVSLNTKKLVLLGSELMYWFLFDNPENQELGFEELDFFLETLDNDIRSHRILRAMFINNEKLMKTIPHRRLGELADTIAKEGKKYAYLTLFASITNVGEKNIPKNQFEITKLLASKSRFSRVAEFLVPVSSPEYQDKLALMRGESLKALDDGDAQEEESNEKGKENVRTGDKVSLYDIKDLDPEDPRLDDRLKYHLGLLDVLAACTAGKISITTVEAKIQSIYSSDDIIDAILDDQSLLICKLKLANHLFQAFVDVDFKVQGLEYTASIWRLLAAMPAMLEGALIDFQLLEVNGWGSVLGDSTSVSRHRIEFALVCINIIGSFFGRYYQADMFGPEPNNVPGKADLTDALAQELIKDLYTQLFPIGQIKNSRLAAGHKNAIGQALINVNKYAMVYNLQTVEQKAAVLAVSAMSETKEGVGGGKEGDSNVTEADNNLSYEQKVAVSFQKFIDELNNDESIKQSIKNEKADFIRVIEQMPFINDPVVSDLRYEAFIGKLVTHISDNFTIVNGERRLDAQYNHTAIWIIKAFRTMVENKMEMSIYERDDGGGDEEDEKAAPVVEALCQCGAANLLLDLIAIGIDEELQAEAVKLGVALLLKEGGAFAVQTLIHEHLSTRNSELFFKQARITLQKLIQHHEWIGVVHVTEGHEPEMHPEILIVRMLQLFCEGHFLPNQNILREQPQNLSNVNLLDDFVAFFNVLSRLPCQTSTTAALKVSATILEVLQGPCLGNQLHFALNTELIEVMNRVMRAQVIDDCIADDELEMKATCLGIFRALCERQGAKSQIYERILNVVHFDVIQTLAKIFPSDGEEDEMSLMLSGDDLGNQSSSANSGSEEEEAVETQAFVLLQMFCDFKPSLSKELGMPTNSAASLGSGTTCIEVIWDGELHRRFFNVPDICKDLAKPTKDNFVVLVDRSSVEHKLTALLEASWEMYREVKHQQMLTSMGLNSVFNPSMQSQAAWLMFILAFIINVVMIAYYEYPSDDIVSHPVPYFTGDGESVVLGLKAGLVFIAAINLIMYCVVRAPVLYQTLKANGHSTNEAVMYTSLDGKLLYFLGFLLFTIFGLAIDDGFLPFLLLDIIVNNDTTKQVLNAIVVPRREITMGSLVLCFVVYVYAFFIFLYFREDASALVPQAGYTLYQTVQLTFGWGIRGGAGIGDFLPVTLDTRYPLDFMFFLSMQIVMLNLISGVIIITFSLLRQAKNERDDDTLNVCFMCGIGKQEFDRASDEPDGFKRHIKTDQNMWNYVFFIFYLWEQDKDDDDGLDLYIRKLIDRHDISWFPMGRAMCLDEDTNVEEEALKVIKTRIDAMDKKINGEISALQSDVGVVIEQMFQALDKEQKEKIAAESTTHTANTNTFTNSLSDTNTDDAKLRPYGGGYGNSGGSLVDEKMVFVTLLDVVSGAIDGTQGDVVQCSLTCGETHHAGITSESTDADAGFFPDTRYAICSHARVDDNRTLTLLVQVLDASGHQKFAAPCKVQVAELVGGEDLKHVRYFGKYAGDYSSITFMVSCTLQM